MTRQAIMYVWFGFLSIIVSVMGEDNSTPQPTISPISEFIASPKNITVLEGHSAILRCKMKDIIHSCQWFYLENGLDIFDSRNSPTLVKEFRPTRNSDCSIKFSKARLIQSGQWICKGLQIHARKYIVSGPAHLQVLARPDDTPGESDFQDPNENENDVAADITFHLTDEGHIINTKLGASAVLGCRANMQLESCAWIKPDATKLHFRDGDTNTNYIHQGNYTEGNCSLKINAVSEQDEGNWRCVVSTSAKGDKLGPLIHLHVQEFGSHTEGVPGSSGGKANDSSLVIVLVVTSLILLLIIVALVSYMYKRVWRRNSPPHKYLDSNKSTTSDYSNYGSTWLPNVTKDQKLMDESTEMQSNYDVNQPQNTRYLDMTGNKRGEGYIMFPASSIRSSMSSRTTLSTIPVGQNAINDSDGSARTSASDSLHSVSTFGNASSDPAGIQNRALPKRSESVYSSGHLYEEIDETRRKNPEDGKQPEYANMDEDPEGYMIPKACSPDESITMEGTTSTNNQTRAPPYSKISATGLIPDSDGINMTSNPTYSEEGRSQMPEESYDAPPDPPVPVRTDSAANNPLAEYDVPKSTPSTDPHSVFV